MGKGDVWLWLAAFALLSLVALFAYAPIFAVDFFWQLELGKLIVERHAIPNTDMFSSVHPDAPYVQFQWLWEALAYGAHALGGLRGVRVFQVLTLVGSFVALGVASKRLLDGPRAFLLCAFALVLFEDRFQTRPSATALGFCALLLPLWLDPTRRERAWLWAGGVACVWSNMHSGESVLAVLAFAALAVGSLLDRQGARRDALLLAAVCAGVLLSPTFFDGLTAIAPQLDTGNKEFRPTYTMLENGLTPSFVLIGLGPSLVALAYAFVWKRASWSERLLCLGMLVLSQQAVRNAFLCVVPLCAVLRRVTPPQPAVLAFSLLAVAFHDHVFHGYGGLARAAEVLPDDLAPDAFPEQLADFMVEAQIEGSAINDGKWGGYLIWRLWPRVHVFVDTRQNLDAEQWPVFLASQRSDTRPAALDHAFRRWGLELAIFRGPSFPLITPPPEWKLLYKAGDQELYQHRDGPHAAANLAKARDGSQRWLAAHERERQRAEKLLRSATRADQLQGSLLASKLSFEAGDYAQTLRLTSRGLTITEDAQLRYRAALSAYVLGDPASATSHLRRLQTEALSAAQRARVAVLARALNEKSNTSAR